MKGYDVHAPFGSDRDQELEKRKHRAALYLSVHKGLLQKEEYLRAYNKLLDEYAREFAYNILKKPIALVSEEERAVESASLESEASTISKKKLERYIEDVEYIVEWVKSGKSLIVYIDD